MTEQSMVSLACKDDEDQLERKRCWAEFSTDILSLILRHLFLGDRRIFRLVCKSWNLVYTLSLPLPPPVRSPHFDSPCFVFPNTNNTWTLFHSLYNDSCYFDFPELLGATISYSKYGWLLMSQGNKTYFFFNPSTKVKIKLPLTDYTFCEVCFSSPPTSVGECVVFGIFSITSTRSQWEFGYLKLGEREWSVYEYPNTYRSRSTNCSPVFCNGLFYCIDQSGNVGVFNPDDEYCHWVQYNKCLKKRLSKKVRAQSYMAEVNGEIWGVFVTQDDRQVGVYKWNSKEFVWNPLQSLGNKCLYVSPRVSFAETCADKSLANKIYFNMFHGENGIIYSLANRMFYSVGGGFASREFYGLIKSKNGIWFKPIRGALES